MCFLLMFLISQDFELVKYATEAVTTHSTQRRRTGIEAVRRINAMSVAAVIKASKGKSRAT
jgi:hypothetical protein